MKKTFKGFTLVECLVAMAILAIAGTLMAGIYANVASRNNFNTFNNASLSNQMAYIEKYENANTVKITNTHSGTTPPKGTNSGTTAYVKVKNSTTSLEYSFPVDIYIMYSRDTQNQSTRTGLTEIDSSGNASGGSTNSAYGKVAGSFSTNGTDKNKDGENQGNLRYKYLLGHTS